jgi:hypothetical protein
MKKTKLMIEQEEKMAPWVELMEQYNKLKENLQEVKTQEQHVQWERNYKKVSDARIDLRGYYTNTIETFQMKEKLGKKLRKLYVKWSNMNVK